MDHDKLYKLLVLHEKLRGYPKLKPIADQIEKELEAFGIEPEPEEDPQASIFPKDSGVTQTDTNYRR